MQECIHTNGNSKDQYLYIKLSIVYMIETKIDFQFLKKYSTSGILYIVINY